MHVHRMSDTAAPPAGLSDDQFEELRRLLLPGHELATMMLADYKKQRGIHEPSEEEREEAETENTEHEKHDGANFVPEHERLADHRSIPEHRDPMDQIDDRDPTRMPAEEPSRGFTEFAERERQIRDEGDDDRTAASSAEMNLDDARCGQEPEFGGRNKEQAEIHRAKLFDGKPDQGQQASLTGGPSLAHQQFQEQQDRVATAGPELEGGAAHEKDRFTAETGEVQPDKYRAESRNGSD